MVTDAASGFIWSHPVFRKAEITPEFISLITKLEREFPRRVKIIRTDNGTEFCNARFADYLKTLGISHQTSIPYEHELNGRAENSNRLILESTRALLFAARFPSGFWSYAMRAATFTHNLIPPARGGRSP